MVPFSWMPLLFSLCPNIFLLVDMNSIISRSGCTDWAQEYICTSVCFLLFIPLYFLHVLVVHSFFSDLFRQLLLHFPAPAFSSACVFCHHHVLPWILPLTAHTCEHSIEPNNTRKWLHSVLDCMKKRLAEISDLQGWTLAVPLMIACGMIVLLSVLGQ